MASPSEVFSWATDANYTGGPEAGTATKTSPSSGRKAEGFEPAAKPTAQNFNWLLNLIASWIQYLTTSEIWLLGTDGYVDASSGGAVIKEGTTIKSTTTSAGVAVFYRIPLDPERVISSITVFGRDGNVLNVETITVDIAKTNHTTNAQTQIGTTKSSAGNINGNTSVSFTTADAGFSPSGYEVTSDPHWIKVSIPSTSADREVQIYAIKITTVAMS